MCGIAGLYYFIHSINLSENANRMSQKIRHRGPDDEGFLHYDFINKTAICLAGDDTIFHENKANYLPKNNISDLEDNQGIVLIHRRLSILDLSELGHQPMSDSSQRYWITFNGEIYNFTELRDELIALGYSFISRSDTEVILHAFDAWKEASFLRFNGMFSFALLDTSENQLWLVRDPFGIKPLYYVHNDAFFAFASEQKAFWALDNFNPSVCENSVADYLLFGRLEEKETGLVKEITEIKPGTYVKIDISTNKKTTQKYYHLEVEIGDRKIIDDPISEIQKLVRRSIERRAFSDVSVATLLSGGLDSSIITSELSNLITRNKSQHGLDAFTATFSGTTADESEFAKSIAKSTFCNWIEVTPTAQDFAHDLPYLIYQNDLPILHTSTYAQLKLMQAVRNLNHKVVFDGQGGDELFAGYDRYFPIYFNQLGFIKKVKFLANLTNAPISFKWLAQFQIKTLIGNKISNEFLIKNKLGYNNLTLLSQNEALKLNASVYYQSENNLNEKLASDFVGNEIKNLVRWSDRTGMAANVEARFPLADDQQLINYVMNLPSNLKIQNGWGKYLLRRAFEGSMPHEITWRKDKKGFTSPLIDWMVAGAPILVNYLSPHIRKFIVYEGIKDKFIKDMDNKPSFNEAQLWLRIIS